MWAFADRREIYFCRSETETSLARSSSADEGRERVQELNTLSSGLMEIMVVLFRSSVLSIHSTTSLCFSRCTVEVHRVVSGRALMSSSCDISVIVLRNRK